MSILQRIVLFSQIWQLLSSCVFDILTTPEINQRNIEFDLSDETTLDHGWGVWTKYQPTYGSPEYLSLDTENMHVLSEKYDVRIVLSYYITIDRINQIFYHRLAVLHDQSFQIRELKVLFEIVGIKWVFFYFCYNQASKTYSMFLYVTDDTIHVAMSSGGPLTSTDTIKEYYLGQTVDLINPFDTQINYNLTPFIGIISDMDLRVGTIYYYGDIQTFLDHLDSGDCIRSFQCKGTANTISFNDQTQYSQYKLQYVDSRFAIRGWVKVLKVDQYQSRNDVFFRFSMKKNYMDDQYLGDKALFWKYVQISDSPFYSGMQLTTYHEYDPLVPYVTSADDSISLINSYYSSAITYWHWFIYQEGMSGTNNIQLFIQWGNGGNNVKQETFKMQKVHLTETFLYLNLGGDKFYGFQGNYQSIEFSYCFPNDVEKYFVCHYSCISCYGPSEKECIICPDEKITNRIASISTSQCACKDQYQDVGQQICKDKQSLLLGITILEAEETDTSNCKLGEFQIVNSQGKSCLKCPQSLDADFTNKTKILCLNCLFAPLTWYQNPICTEDFEQKIKYYNGTYFHSDRFKKDYDFYLINFDSLFQPEIELCQGCLGFANINDTKYIEKNQLNQLTKILCKPCYNIINGECLKIQEHCDQCIEDQCTSCLEGYTLNNGICFKCPIYCPQDCNYDGNNYTCNSCIDGYYFDADNKQCQECGRNCQVCRPISTSLLNYTYLQCLKCINDTAYFLSADYTNCLLKNIPNCVYQYQEYVGDPTTNITFKMFLLSSLDIKVNETGYVIYNRCGLCKKNYVNYFYEIGNPIYTDQCVKFNDFQNEWKPIQFEQFDDEYFQIVRYQDIFAKFPTPKVQLLVAIGNKLIYTDPYQNNKNVEAPVFGIINRNSNQSTTSYTCTQEKCRICLKNYVWSNEYCILCNDGYYAHLLAGSCYKCPTQLNCKTCQHQHNVFLDGWKWDLRGFLQTRSCQAHCYHNYNLWSVSTDYNAYGQYCTSCDEDEYELHGLECIKKISNITCNQTIIQNGQFACALCNDNEKGYKIQTLINGNCTQCPYYCMLCQSLSAQQIKQLNPFFSPKNITDNEKHNTSDFWNFTKYCLKSDQPKNIQILNLYRNPLFGSNILCKEYKQCYKYLYQVMNVYCDMQKYTQDLNALVVNSQEYTQFKINNIPINDLFSQSLDTHFKEIETYNIMLELNSQAVKMAQYVINFKFEPNQQCIIPRNSFISSNLRMNVFTLTNLEIVLQSDPNNYIFIYDTFEIRNFSKVTFKNLKLKKFSAMAKINLLCPTSIEFLIENLFISNSDQFTFQINVQNPKSITINSLSIQNSKIQNINGLIDYYFTTEVSTNFQFKLQNLQITNCQITNSLIIAQNLTLLNNNQNHLISNTLSSLNTYINSSLFITNFPITIRQSTFYIDTLTAQNDTLIKSSYAILHGTLLATLQNINIKFSTFKSSSLFKLPLFQILNFNFLNNNLEGIDDRVITNNIDTLYTDQSQVSNHEVYLQDIIFSENNYFGNRVFIEITESSNFKNQSVVFQTLNIQYNKYITGKKPGNITLENSTIYLQVTTVKLFDVYLTRSLSLPEITILNANDVSIQTFTGMLATKFQVLHPTQICATQIDRIRQTTILFFFNILNLELVNIKLKNILTINLPFILIKSPERSNIRQNEVIKFKDCSFTYNTLIVDQMSEQLGIVSIISQQEQEITFENIVFQNNIQFNYVEDLAFISSSTILLLNPYSKVFINKAKFQSNIAINSQNTNLVIICYKLNLVDSIFQDENNLDYSNIVAELLWGYPSSQTVYLENLNSVFQISSKGGAGYISGSILEIVNITVTNTQALQGGGFYLIPLSDGQIKIADSLFSNCQSKLQDSSHSQGGTFYIEASQALLNLIIENCNVTNSFSRNEGGVLFIEPSRQSNIVLLQNLFFLEQYSLLTPLLHIPVTFSNQNLILLVQFYNVSCLNTYSGFMNYMSLMDDLKDAEVTQQNQNYLISIEQGNLTLINSTFKNIFFYGFLNFENCVDLTIQNSDFYNISLLTQSLFSVQLNKKISSNLRFDEIVIHDIEEFQGSVLKPQQGISLLPELEYKCNDNYKPPSKLQSYYTESIKEKINNYNLYLFVSKRQSPSNIIAIDQISNLHYLYFSLLQIYDNYCPNCTSSAFEITNIDDATDQTIIVLTEISVKNNSCGQIGCLVLSSKKTNQITLPRYSRLLSSDLQEGQLFGVKVQDSSFIGNTASYGGALLISSLHAIINNCQFLENKASKSGGAIFYEQSSTNSKLYIYNSVVSNNEAYVGGGIYLGQYEMNDQSKLNNFIKNNQAVFYGNNVVNSPSQLTLKIGKKTLPTERIVNNSTEIIDQVVITPYLIAQNTYKNIMVPSGQIISEYNFFDESTQSFIPYNFSFRLLPLNKQKDQIKNLDGSVCTIKSRKVINNTVQQHDSSLINKAAVSYNTTSQDYNLDQLILIFDPDQDQFGFVQIEFACDSIKIAQFKETPPYDFIQYFTNYKLRANIQTFQCKRGEYKKSDGTCQLCDSAADQYNFIAGEQCQIRDQLKMDEVNPARVKLKPYYWRPYESSHTIEYCLNFPENCVGGWDPGNGLCGYAHIGALCEQCDLYNIRGQGKFSVSTIYKCGSCENIGDNAIKVGLISLWTMISIFLSVKGTVETIQKMVSEQKLQKFKIFAKNPKAGYGSVLIKVLTNYLQIIGAVATFQLQLPSLLQGSVKSVSNPVEAMSFSLDCFLITLSNIDIIYFRMIWALIMPVFYTIAFLLIYAIAIVINLTKPNKSAITTTSIYLFTYLQPTLLGGFISLLSFRRISDILWIQGNVAYRFDTETHINWLLTFILPSTLVLSLIIPLYMFSSLYRQQHKLDEEETRKSWGYLYNEYSPKAYFWEIIKILEKGFMIVFLTFYEDLIIIKASLIFIITFIYSLLTKKYKPYKLSYLNFIDDLSTLICETSIVLGMTIYSAIQSDNQEIIWPFYVILITINGVFISLIIWEIILAQLNDQQENIDKIRSKINEKFPKLQFSNWICKQLLTHRGEQQRRIKRRYQMIRRYLMDIVKQNMMQNVHNHPLAKLQKEEDFMNSVKNSNKCLLTDDSKLDFMSPNINYKMKVYPEIGKADETDIVLEQSVTLHKKSKFKDLEQK